MRIWPGKSYPLGAAYDGAGTNFSIFSEAAEKIELCLFDSDGQKNRYDLPEVSGYIWHGYCPDVGPDQRYAVVINPYFDWTSDRVPQIPIHEMVIYETHVKGFSGRHPDIPEEMRETYADLSHPAAIGQPSGPTLSFKGIDNAAYYRLVQEDRRYYFDFTGTGNSLNMRHPHVLQLIMDSLRYWVTEMHVDGFRFDLAAALARELFTVERLSVFFDLIQQDPVVSQVKLIAEPWDVGEGGYQVGKFPPLWSEWNGKYRDCVRDFWRGQDQTLGEFAYRFTGSSDLYEQTGRRPFSSINFVTAHDGFTLNDLVSYNDKHNEANGEHNQDGESHNRSWNCGAEGATDNPDVLALRTRQKKNFLATLFLAQGVPMLLGGDEIGLTQQGNNNGYCQDNEISWYNWESMDQDLLEFTRRLIAFRLDHPVFKPPPVNGCRLKSIPWCCCGGCNEPRSAFDLSHPVPPGIRLR